MKISHRIIEGADHLIFEGGGVQNVWVISEKISYTLISMEKILARKYLAK